MRTYKNTKTNAIIETECEINGEHWIEITEGKEKPSQKKDKTTSGKKTSNKKD